MSHSMENKQAATATSRPVGMCEKLYSIFQPTIKPLRRLTFRQQAADTAAQADSSSAAHSDHHSHHVPQLKLPEPVAPLTKDKHNHTAKAQEKKELPSPAPPKVQVMPLGAVPQPQRPPAKEEVEKPKKGINEKVDDYIIRTKGKIRVGSGVGRVASSK